MNPADMRREYTTRGLLESDVEKEPFAQFGKWFSEAMAAQVLEPNAMTLATVGKDGKPHARIVLMKGFDSNGFVFFTNYESRKGRQIDENPFVALCFAWLQLERQVNIAGSVERVPRAETEAYFRTRPVGSQLGAWASRQSERVTSREQLEKQLAEVTERFAGKEIPAPGHWGGYRVKPESIEFWQGRPNRMHDRIVYRKSGDNWLIERISS